MQSTVLRPAQDGEDHSADLTAGAEALVLFEYLHELDEQNGEPDEAERIALWRLAGALEKTLTEPLAPSTTSS